MIIAVADTGPLIHLAEIDSLGLLGAVDELLLPATVYEELEAGGIPPGLDGLVFDVVEADEDSEWFTTGLDAGEASALDVASKRNAVLLTDDLAAREAAQDSDVEVHGSIGVITLAFSRGVVSQSEASSLMRSLQAETSLFVTDAVVERGIDVLAGRSSE